MRCRSCCLLAMQAAAACSHCKVDMRLRACTRLQHEPRSFRSQKPQRMRRGCEQQVVDCTWPRGHAAIRFAGGIHVACSFKRCAWVLLAAVATDMQFSRLRLFAFLPAQRLWRFVCGAGLVC